MEPKTKKIVLGISIGCGGILILFLATIVSFVVWIKQPGELLQPGRLVGDDTVGYAEWTLRLEDPGTEQFVSDLLDELEDNQNQAFDQLGSGPLAAFGQWKQRRDREKLQDIFPIVAAWTLTQGDTPDQLHHLLSVSIEKMGNTMVFGDWIMGMVIGRSDPDLQKLKHQDEWLFHSTEVGDGLTFFLRGNDVFFTYDLDTAKHAVDRLQPVVAEARPPIVVDELFARIPESQSLRAVLTNESGEIYDLWRKISVPPDDPEALENSARQLTGLTLGGSLRGDETFEGELSLRCPSADWAESYREEALARFRDGLAPDRLNLTAEATTAGEWIRIRFRIQGAMKPLFGILEDRVDGVVTLPDDVTQ